ncbi:restriction endonuclease subunit S [Vreelandella aquamarina]|uniref:restriction endonuclease subunit S n=1 Tax=Vreelandella aquamarina TaxID=77097 RepID=UPI00384E8BB8
MNIAATFAKYHTTINSGTAWLGDIPADWGIKKMKFLFRDHSQKEMPNAELLSVTQNQGVVPRTLVESRMVMPSGNLKSFKFIEKGDFAISLRSFEGGLEYCHHDGIISPAYTVLKRKSENLLPAYYRYLFKSAAFISELQTSIVGIREGKNISFEELSYSLMPVPGLNEQRAIASFLDNKCAKIDEAVRIKEAQIKLLRERRQILIQQAVTRGLNPDAPMKDSGIDWIGEIPAHWEVLKLRNMGRFQNGISEGADYFGSGDPFVTYGDVFKNEILPESASGLARSDVRTQNLYSVKAGDIFFTRTSEVASEIGIASAAMVDMPKATFSGFLIRFRPYVGSIASEFARFLFRCNYVRVFFAHEVNIVTRASLGQELLKNLPVFSPPLEEQIQIADWLAEKTEQLDNAISIKQEQISKLKEYKTTLINAAVTGKIKVS